MNGWEKYSDDPVSYEVFGTAKTAPLAICIAALRARLEENKNG